MFAGSTEGLRHSAMSPTTPLKTPNTKPRQPSYSSRFCSAASILIAAILLSYAAYQAYNTVAPCQMPREWDVLRDIGIAQSMVEGRYPEDPCLAGEISWYNPLTGLILAMIHGVSGESLMRIAVLAGPVINLLAPIGMYLFISMLFGHAAALASLFLFLFGKEGSIPSYWTCAYSPWLLAPLYSMGLFFLTLAFYKKAIETSKAPYFAATGSMLGLTFLAHTAPAVVAGGTIALMTGVAAWRSGKHEGRGNNKRFIAVSLILIFGIAFFVSLPYTGPLLWRYQFHIQNPWPSLYASQNVELQHFPEHFRNALTLRNGIALLGAFVLLFRKQSLEARLSTFWGIVVGLLMLQQYLWQALRLNDIIIPSIVPGHHAAMHLSAFRTALFGVGILYLGQASSRFLTCCASRLPGIRTSPLLTQPCITGGLVIVTGICLYAVNPFSQRIDFLPPGGVSHYELYERHVPMYAWIRDNTKPQAVFLCPDENLGIKVVMPAGRKLVNPMLLYFNPYVNRGPTTVRQKNILEALDKKDEQTLYHQSKEFPILYLLQDEPIKQPPPFSKEVHREGGSVLFKINTSSRTLP